MLFDITQSDMEWFDQPGDLALATVIQTWRSSPRPVGSRLIIRPDGNFTGSVSGGCVEGAVVSEALDILNTGKPMTFDYGVSNEAAWEVGLACGGQLSIHIQPLNHETDKPVLKKLAENISRRKACILLTELESGKIDLIECSDEGQVSHFSDELAAHLRDVMLSAKSSVVQAEGKRYFVDLHLPKKRLIIIGAVHIAEYLCQLALMANFDVMIIDPRSFFRREGRFSGAQLSSDWPDEGVREVQPDRETALVTLTHDPKLDQPALREILMSDAFFVGSLGSRRTHAKRLDELRAEGLEEEALSRIKGPVGLDIGALSPQEIAISIMAQIIEHARKSPERNDKS